MSLKGKGYLAFYYLCTAGAGGVSNMMETWNAKVERWVGGERKMTDMLLGEKLGIFAWGVATGPVFVPLKMLNNLNKIDIYFRGHNQKDYGFEEKKTVFDYMYSL